MKLYMRLHEQQLSSDVADRDSGCGYIFVVLLACTVTQYIQLCYDFT